MGALHEGHIELIRKAKEISDITIVTIIANPKQFSNKKDLETYPSSEKNDIKDFFPSLPHSLAFDCLAWFEEIVPSLIGLTTSRKVSPIVNIIFSQPKITILGSTKICSAPNSDDSAVFTCSISRATSAICLILIVTPFVFSCS